MLDVTYNSTKIIDSLEVTPPVTVTYNGSTIATLNEGDTKTLQCNGKVMLSDVELSWSGATPTMPAKGDIITMNLDGTDRQYRVLKINGSIAEVVAMFEASNDIKFNANIPLPCFLTGTKITMADGSTKNIEDLTYNDELRVWDFDEGKYSTAPICWLTKLGLTNDHYYKLTFSDGTELCTTGTNSNHKVYNVDERFFKGVDKTEIGDRIFSENGIVTVINKEYIEEEVPYYNVITSKKFDCFANGILTADRYGNTYPIDENMIWIKDDRDIRPYSEFQAAGISEYWYNNFRLGEQIESLESTIKYIAKCEAYMRPLLKRG